jgi:phage shock protein PspC (stress-responsive transcriptional regulator)
MNKTVSCNISGLIFNLEELAFDKLSQYLNTLKDSLKGSEGSDEVYSDIELRIAELFSKKLSPSQQVIVMQDVEEVIRQLGDPKDYVEQDAGDPIPENESSQTSSSNEERKVFMRDTDNGVIAGVCAGISAYFGIDLTLIRVLFIIFLLFPGFGGLAYIILWIAAPSAKTAAEKLRLRGEPVNIDTLKREVQEAAQRVEDYSKRKFSKKRVKQFKKQSSSFGSFLRSLIGFALLLGATFGILFFLIFSLSRVGIFTSQNGEQLVSMYEFSNVIFNSTFHSFLGWTGILGTVLIPLILIAILGVKLVFNIHGSWVKYPSTILMVLWFLSIGVLTLAGFQIAREFTHHGETDEALVSVSSDELVIHVPELFLQEIPSGSSKATFNYVYAPLLELDDESVRSGLITLEISASEDDLFHVSRERSSYGITRNKAMRLASNVEHEVVIDQHEVTIQPYYTFPAMDKLRGQHVTIIVKVPEGKSIRWKGNKKQLNVKDRLR